MFIKGIHNYRSGPTWVTYLKRAGQITISCLLLLAFVAGPVSADGGGVPQWPANPNWQKYVLGDGGTTAAPVAVTSVSGNVTNAQALVTGDGVATLTNTAGQAPPMIILDYGKEVGGLPFFDVSSVSPASSATSVTMRAGYSELLRYLTTTQNVSTQLAVAANAGDTNVKTNSVADFYDGGPITIDTGANAENGTITSVGTPSVSSLLFNAASVGDTNVKLTNVTGLTVGAPLTIDTGANQENVTISSVGTAGVNTTVSAPNATGGVVVPNFSDANWIWNTANSQDSAPSGTIYVRKTFDVPDASAVSSAVLGIAVDDEQDTYVNGTLVSSLHISNGWQTFSVVDIKPYLVTGTNVIAVAATNGSGAGGLLAAFDIDGSHKVSDASWKALAGTPASPPAGWNTAGFDDSAWPAAFVAGLYGIGPWNNNVSAPNDPTVLEVSSVDGFNVGDTISIDTGANQETRTVTDIYPGRCFPFGCFGQPSLTVDSPLTIVHSAGAPVLDLAYPGTGVDFTPALQYPHAALTGAVSIGTGISFTPALTADHPVGTSVSTVATVVSGDRNGNNGVGTDGSRTDNFDLTAASGGTTVGNAINAVQGGERFQAIALTTPGTVELSGAGITIKHFNQGASAYQGYFVSSDDTLNQIWYAGVYTDQTDSILPGGVCSSSDPSSCSQTSTILDGAKRDRRPWSGDLTTENRTMFDSLGYGPGASDIIKNTLGQFGSAPRSNGEICGQISNWVAYPTSPVNCSPYSPTYSMYWSRGLQQYYLYTGDTAFVESEYQTMKNELAYDRTSWDPTTGLTNADGRDWDFYDGSKCGSGCAVAATNMLYYDDLAGAAWVAQTLAAQDPTNLDASTWAADAATWSSQAADLKAAINAQLFNTSLGVYQLSTTDNGSHAATAVPQDANSQAIVFGVAPRSDVSGILSYLQKNLWGTYGPQPYSPDANYSNVISPFITGYELDARFASGETASALALTKLMWAQMVDQSGPFYTGTLWEKLGQDGQITDSNASLAHGWASAPVSAFSSYLLGVQPTGVGYSTWQVKPQPGNLSWSEGKVPTPGGAITVKWAQNTGTGMFHLEVNATEGTGEVWVPVGSAPEATSVVLSGDATLLRRDGNYDVYSAGTGTIEFLTVNYTSLKDLVTSFSTDPNVTSGLNDKVDAAASATSAKTQNNILGAFINQVNAQSGKALSESDANLLILLAQALMQ